MPVSVKCTVLSRTVLDAEVLCSGVDIPTFASKMYQWASTLTYQGRNMPFCLPFRTDPLDTGFVVKSAIQVRLAVCRRLVSLGSGCHLEGLVESSAQHGDTVLVSITMAIGKV